MREIIERLVAKTEDLRVQFKEGFKSFAARHGLTGWEGWYSPGDEGEYRFVLENIRNDDVVLDLGAGDLCLALRLAERARKVYAVEVNPLLMGVTLETIGFTLPANLIVICGNILDIPFPTDVSVAVLLMRHCQHLREYIAKLKEVGCRRLITNARWKSQVEVISLTESWRAFSQVRGGWYACLCGQVGFVPCPPDCPDECPVDLCLTQVKNCPACGQGQ
ncbi:rRNA adenine N-6-methyltransferase family protein [Candidatus Hakubella thermalkaliphila]|uniref:rRNA adenine N-6-methyltransferase family protein n=1 Tax=Candidatus Hakubella thermalkaliphila TaxID=2754717 RepID=UPI001592B7CA|nr:rRNA adenine N-6-methyltransferase family protein [Candidatus Hakubella thermalkaliphila]